MHKETLAEGVELYCGDCRELLENADFAVDVTITDPPYDQVTHAGARTRVAGQGAQNVSLIEFAAIDGAGFVKLVRAICRRTARWLVLTADWRHLARGELDELLVRAGVWIKPNGAPQFTGDRPAMGWEAVGIFHRAGAKRWNGGGGRAVWTFNAVRAELHPTQKPIELVVDFVRLFSDAGETVFDPFMGSGTTGVAAVKQGRKFVGVELDPDYFAIACERIRAALDQGDLFVDRPKAEKPARLL